MPLDALQLQKGPGLVEHSNWPLALITGTGADPRPRLRVDTAQTSFWEGREFRMFDEFSILAGQSLFYKYVFLKDFILEDASVQLDEGKCRVVFVADAVDAGSWTPLSVFPANGLTGTPVYPTNTTAFKGGAPTGGTARDVIRLVSSSSGSSAVGASAGEDSPRGNPAGTYFIQIQNYGATTMLGTWKLRWEEREPKSLLITGGTVYS